MASRGAAGPDRRRSLGAAGEATAARWYAEAGYAVVDRNWRSPSPSGRDPERVGGEIDLVVTKDRVVVFSEVKSRRTDRYGEPFEAVTAAKQRRIRALAAMWLRERAPALGLRPGEIRFDVVSILDGRVAVLEGAF